MPRSIVAFVVLLTIACGGSDAPLTTTGPSPVAAKLDAVVFAFAEDFSLSFTRIGATAQVTAVGVFSDQHTQNVTSTCVDWRSDDTRVLSIDSRGMMTAQSNGGSATITTICQSVSARGLVGVNVVQAPGNAPIVAAPPSLCSSPPYTWEPPPTNRCRTEVVV